MDETVKMLVALVEENTRYRMAFLNLGRKMEIAKKEDKNFLLHEEEISEVMELAGVVKKELKNGTTQWF